MRNIKLTIEYDGSRYQGWTRLGKNESSNTIFNKIQEVLRKMTGEFVVDLYCGCRTEVGVHRLSTSRLRARWMYRISNII